MGKQSCRIDVVNKDVVARCYMKTVSLIQNKQMRTRCAMMGYICGHAIDDTRSRDFGEIAYSTDTR